MKLFKFNIIILFILLISGCTNMRKYIMYDRDIEIAKIEPVSKEFIISSGDVLSINVQDVKMGTFEFLNPQMSKKIQTYTPEYERGISVDKNGDILLPMVGKVKAAGMEITSLRDTLIQKYSTYLKQPYVDIKVVNFFVTVLGEVKQPGKVLANGESITISQALALAGGVSMDGNRKEVKIIRENKNGESSEILVDLTAKDNAYPNQIYLKPNDVVYVPETRKAFINRDFQLLTTTVSALANTLTLIILILRNY